MLLLRPVLAAFLLTSTTALAGACFDFADAARGVSDASTSGTDASMSGMDAGSTDDGPSGATQTVLGFLDQFAQTLCAKFAACCAGQVPDADIFSEQACRLYHSARGYGQNQPFVGLAAAAEAGVVSLDPVKAAACLGDIGAIDCANNILTSRQSIALLTDCASAVSGTLAPDMACSQSIECAPGAFCTAPEGGAGTCAPLRRDGGSCGGTGNLQAANKACSYEGAPGSGLQCMVVDQSGVVLPGASWACKAPLPTGAKCVWDLACTTGICDDGSHVCATAGRFSRPALCRVFTAPQPSAHPCSSVAACDNNVGTSDDSSPKSADFDGAGNSYSAEALAAAGVTPGGAVVADGITYPWPSVMPGQLDNLATSNQIVNVPPKSAKTLGLLGSSASNGTVAQGTFIVTYQDHSTQAVPVEFGDWVLGVTISGTTLKPSAAGNSIAVTAHYQNSGTGGKEGLPTYVFSVAVPLTSSQPLVSLTFPSFGGIHIFDFELQ